MRGGWSLSWGVRLLVRVRVERDGHMPFVATVGGFVVLGAEITDFDRHGARTRSGGRGIAFQLRPAGEWFDGLLGLRLPTGPGGPWRLDGPLTSPYASRELR